MNKLPKYFSFFDDSQKKTENISEDYKNKSFFPQFSRENQEILFTNDYTDEKKINFDISKSSMKHYFPQPINIKKKTAVDNGLSRQNTTIEEMESEPKMSDFSHLSEIQQNEAKELLKVKVTSTFNNFDGFLKIEYLIFFIFFQFFQIWNKSQKFLVTQAIILKKVSFLVFYS